MKVKVADFSEIEGVPCPCGFARRAFAGDQEFPGTLHVTEITEDSRKHYHKTLTETDYILECDSNALLEIDEETLPLKPGMAVVIPPGVRHRAVGKMKILNIVIPEFDPADEYEVDE